VGRNKKTPDEFVPWSQGAELLGMKRTAFFHYVRTGQIRSEPGRQPRDGRYSLEDIYQLKERREQGKPRKPYKKKLAPVLVDWLQPSDIPAGLKLDYLLYQESIDLAEAAVYQAWRRNNNLLTMGAFSKDRSECLAYLQLVPLQEQTILDILRGKREENSIKPEEVLAYDKPGAYTLLGISAVCHPERPDLLFRLLDKIMDFWVEQYPERYVTKVYAQAVSERGDMLVQHLFMAPRPDLAPHAYELSLARPAASRIVRRFQEKLLAKAPLPPDLHSTFLSE
jgi:hypothetical protein